MLSGLDARWDSESSNRGRDSGAASGSQPGSQVARIADRDIASSAVLRDGSGESATGEVRLPGQVIGVDVKRHLLKGACDAGVLESGRVDRAETVKLWAGRGDVIAEAHGQQEAPTNDLARVDINSGAQRGSGVDQGHRFADAPEAEWTSLGMDVFGFLKSVAPRD